MATACRAVSVVAPAWPVFPASSVLPTTTVRSPASRPCPRTRSILAESSQPTCPSSFQSWVKESRRLNTSAGVSAAPLTPCTAPASATTSTGRSRALLGMQAQYEHSPPTSSDSTITAVRPPLTARSATFSPVGPAPITITSYVSSAIPFPSSRPSHPDARHTDARHPAVRRPEPSCQAGADQSPTAEVSPTIAAGSMTRSKSSPER